jgi:hypothetical protein
LRVRQAHDTHVINYDNDCNVIINYDNDCNVIINYDNHCNIIINYDNDCNVIYNAVLRFHSGTAAVVAVRVVRDR